MNNINNPPGRWTKPERNPTITEILSAKKDHGDVQLAYKVLGLSSTNDIPTALRPDARPFIRWCNFLLRRIWTEHWNNTGKVVKAGSVEHRRIIEANKRLLSAIHTIAGIRRPGHPKWSPYRRVKIASWFIQPAVVNNVINIPARLINKDLPLNLNLTTWPTQVYVPMAYAAFRNYYNNANPAQLAIDQARTERVWGPTPNMITDAERREEQDLMDETACYGFTARPSFEFPQDKSDAEKRVLRHTFYAGPTPKNENSLWYSLAVLVENFPTKAKEIKGVVSWWFTQIMTDPTALCHRERFRMYSQLLATSANRRNAEEVRDWGAMDLWRCLARNASDSGMPMDAGYHEMLYLVADFLNCEIITFTRPDRIPGFHRFRDIESLRHAFPYSMKVYGRSSTRNQYQLRFGNRRQILLVTDPDMRHFQLVIRVEPELPRRVDANGVQNAHFITTGAFDPWDRFAPMPWWAGYQRNAAGVISGHWIDDDRRQNFNQELMDMIPSDITRGMVHPVTGAAAFSPYHFVQDTTTAHWLNSLQWKEYFSGDADTDARAFRQHRGLIDGWQQSQLTAAHQQDILPVQALVNGRPVLARAGTRDPVYKSSSHFEGVKRMWDMYLDDDVSSFRYHNENGFLKVHLTENEDRLPVWHKKKKMRRS